MSGCSIEKKEQFNLRWNHFESTLSGGLFELMEEKAFVDVTLGCENQFVQAHKNILSVCSPYFKSLFNANPCKHPIVILKDVRLTELKALLQFMYRGEVSIGEDELPSLLCTADALSIKGLASIKKNVINKVNQVLVNTSSSTTDSATNQEPPRKKQKNGTVSSPPSTVEPPIHIDLDNVDTIDLSNIKMEPETLELLDIEHVTVPSSPQPVPHSSAETPVAGPSNESFTHRTSQSSIHNQNSNSQTSEVSVGDDDGEYCQEFLPEQQWVETSRGSRRKRVSKIRQDTYQELLEELEDRPSDSDCEYQVSDFADLNTSDSVYPKKTNTQKSTAKGERQRQIFYPAVIPQYSSSVLISIKNGTVLYRPADFVKESCMFLRSLKEYPLPCEYTAYAKTLVNKYPILKKLPGDFEHDYTALSRCLSTKMRSIRMSLKLQKVKISAKNSSVSDDATTAKPATRKQKETQENAETTDNESLQESTEILKNPNTEKSSIIQAVTETFDSRRPEIKKSPSILLILNQWPVFRQEEVIVHEASLVLKNKLADFSDKYTIMMNNLAQFRCWCSCPVPIMESEGGQVHLLNKFQYAMNMNVKNGDVQAINVSTVNVKPPAEIHHTSPITWICMADDKIEEAYILIEGNKMCQLNDISCENILKVFLCTFYCFHEKYPKCYEHFMEFIEFCLLGKETFKGNANYNMLKERYIACAM